MNLQIRLYKGICLFRSKILIILGLKVVTEIFLLNSKKRATTENGNPAKRKKSSFFVRCKQSIKEAHGLTANFHCKNYLLNIIALIIISYKIERKNWSE